MKKDLLKSLKRDCVHFRGDIPCEPHRMKAVWCPECSDYTSREGIILILKLGAKGDVIRTTPLLAAFRKKFPKHEIWWMTKYPEVLPNGIVAKALPLTLESVLSVQAIDFDLLVNLDKEPEALGLASMLRAKRTLGFLMRNGRAFPAGAETEHKWLTGIHNGYSKQNTLSYPEEIFEMCGFKFNGEEYLLPEPQPLPDEVQRQLTGKNLVGLVTGTGSRWPTRNWPPEHCAEFCRLMRGRGFSVLLLGGAREDGINRKLAAEHAAFYCGFFPFRQFISLVNVCDVVVTPVTMPLHVAVGLRKQVVLLNNIFNRNEFYLYGRGEIVEPSTGCECYYAAGCRRSRACAWDIQPEAIYQACLRRLALVVSS